MDLKDIRIFYGWWIVSAVVVISAYIVGVVSFGFTSMFEPIAEEFGWTYTQVSMAGSIRGLEMGLLAPVAGLLVDRFDPRKLIFFGISITGFGLLFLSRITSLASFYCAFILLAAGSSACLGVVPMTVVGHWFRRNLSFAMGIALSGTAFGGLFIPIITWIIDKFSWRVALSVLGLGVWVFILPLSLIVRHKPEKYGYLPDGDVMVKQETDKIPNIQVSNETGVGVIQALASRTFWHIALGFVCHVFAVHAVITHVMPYLSSIGIKRATSSLIASVTPLISVLGRLSFGWLGDRFPKKQVTAAGVALTGISMICFGLVASDGAWLLVPFLLLFGFGYGGPIPMMPALIRENYGTARLGSIIGFVQGIAMLGSITGQPLAGWVFDTYGSYEMAWFAYAAVVMAGALSLYTMPSPGEKDIRS